MIIEKYPTRYIIRDIRGNQEEPSTEFTKLTKSLSVWDEVYFKYKTEIYHYDEDNDILYIPGSYDTKKLADITNNANIIYKEFDELDIAIRGMGRVTLNNGPKDDRQKKAIDFLKGNSYSAGSSQKILSLKTGQGKTYCAINYCVTQKAIPIIFVDQDTLATQWKNSITKFTSVGEDNVYTMSGKKSIEKLMKMSKKEINKYKFFICIHRTMKTILDDDIEEGNKIVNKIGCSIKIFDEAHTEIMSMFKIDESMDIPSMYLTATPERSDPKENIMYKRALREAKMFSTNTGYLKEEPYLNILLCKVNSEPSAKEQCKFKNKYGFNTVAYCKYMEDKYDFFYDKISRLVKFAEKKQERKIVILVRTLSMVESICTSLKEEYPNRRIDRLDGTTKKDKKDEILDNGSIIVTTDMSFSKGIDCKDLQVVINTVPINSAPKTEQMLGRLRKLPDGAVWYFDLIDAGIPMINDMLNKKKKVFTKKAKFIKDVAIK